MAVYLRHLSFYLRIYLRAFFRGECVDFLNLQICGMISSMPQAGLTPAHVTSTFALSIDEHQIFPQPFVVSR